MARHPPARDRARCRGGADSSPVARPTWDPGGARTAPPARRCCGSRRDHERPPGTGRRRLHPVERLRDVGTHPLPLTHRERPAVLARPGVRRDPSADGHLRGRADDPAAVGGAWPGADRRHPHPRRELVAAHEPDAADPQSVRCRRAPRGVQRAPPRLGDGDPSAGIGVVQRGLRIAERHRSGERRDVGTTLHRCASSERAGHEAKRHGHRHHARDDRHEGDARLPRTASQRRPPRRPRRIEERQRPRERLQLLHQRRTVGRVVRHERHHLVDGGKHAVHLVVTQTGHGHRDGALVRREQVEDGVCRSRCSRHVGDGAVSPWSHARRATSVERRGGRLQRVVVRLVRGGAPHDEEPRPSRRLPQARRATRSAPTPSTAAVGNVIAGLLA